MPDEFAGTEDPNIIGWPEITIKRVEVLEADMAELADRVRRIEMMHDHELTMLQLYQDRRERCHPPTGNTKPQGDDRCAD